MLESAFLLTLESLRRLLRRGAMPNVKKIIEKCHAADIAHIMDFLDPEEQRAVFGAIESVEKAAEVLRETSAATNVQVLPEVDPYYLARILEAMPHDDSTDLISRLPQDLAKKVLDIMEEGTSQSVEALMEYGEDTAGGIMTPELLALPDTMTVEEAMREVRRASEAEMVFYTYVVDDRKGLCGVISLRDLLLAPLERTLGEIMKRSVLKVNLDTDQEEVARLVAKYNLLAIPVVDKENHLRGIVTVDDVVDILRDETTEDIIKMTGSDSREVRSWSIFRIASLRLPWLFFSWGGYMLLANIMSMFSGTLERTVFLAGFIPMITGISGNIGTQSSTISVRGLATGRINVKMLGKVISRELGVGVVLGGASGMVIGLLANLQFSQVPHLGVVVGMSLCVAMTISATVAAFIPLLFERMRIDPAVATGPFITSAIDIMGVSIYLTIARFALL